jgi:hypothetical protein
VGWRPGERAARLELETPYEDVPSHLTQQLTSWVLKPLQDNAATTLIWGLEMRVDLANPLEGRLGHSDALREVALSLDDEPNVLLDSADWLLAKGDESSDRADFLDQVLKIGNSAYRVREDRRGLEMRIAPGVRELVESTVKSASGSAGGHLTLAWNASYSRRPDPVKAYSEAIKAVEAAAAPIISPNNHRATLGTIIKDINNKSSKWTFALASKDGDGVDELARMMKLLWDGQTSRHGGVAPTKPETVDAARAAVHLSATLVQFFVGGALSGIDT